MRQVDDLAHALAVLVAEQGSYTYVDKLGNAPTKELALLYVKEALRDLNSLLSKQSYENPKTKEELGKIRMDLVEKQVDQLDEIEDRRQLREVVSLIAAKALARAASLRIGGGV